LGSLLAPTATQRNELTDDERSSNSQLHALAVQSLRLSTGALAHEALLLGEGPLSQAAIPEPCYMYTRPQR